MFISKILNADVRLLFFKAQRRGDDRTSDLFPVEVRVEGHTKNDGTYVAPHMAIRHKKQPDPKKPDKQGQEQAAIADLFADEKPSTEFAPTHELPDGTQVVAHPDEPGVWLDKDGAEYESDNAYPLKPAADAAAEKPIGAAVIEDDTAQYALPEGATFKPGKGTLGAGKWMVELADGYATPLLPSKEQAADAARQLVAMRQRAEAERDAKASRERAVADKVRAGEVLTDQDLQVIGLRPGSSQYSYLSLAIQRLFGIDANHVRKIIGGALREGQGKLGGRKEYADPRKALALVGEHLRGTQKPADRLDYSLPFDQARVPEFGVPSGVSKAERKRLNAKAREILTSKTEGFTEDEKTILRQYSGNGGVGDSLNEFYTRTDVAAAMWKILDTLGIRSGQVEEPSSGPGVFLATAPDTVRVVAVEMDNTSAQVAQALHGDRHEVVNSSLERFATSDGRQFDAVIGNVPFGLRGALIKEDKPDLKTAEQYFLDTAIDKTREGGIVALIVPTGIMDGKNTRGFRERILRKAEFLGAHRLPNTAFEHSHTNVTSDIVIFRKRAPDVAGALGTVKQQVLKDLGVWDEGFLSGRYFQNHPHHIYGTPEAGWRAKAGMGNDFTVSGDMAGVAQAIAESGSYKQPDGVGMVQVLAAIGDDEKARAKAISAALKPRYEGAELGDTKVIDGVTYILQGDPPRWHRVGGQDESPESVSDAADAARMLDELFQAHQGREAVPGDQRKRLVESLDAFVAKHGVPAKNKDLVRAAQHDKALWRLIGAVNKDGSYSDLVTGRFADMDSSNFDAVAARLAIERGAFTADDVAHEWTGGDREAALDHLFASAAYAVDADGKTWTTMDSYLSGDLWSKLDAAKAALEHEGLEEHYRAKYRVQIGTLEETIDPRSLEDVETALSAGWVPLDVVADFFNQRIEAWKAQHGNRSWTPDPMQISYAKGVYTVTGGFQPDNNLLDKYLNRSGVRKDDLPTIEAWNREFKAWACSSDHRERLEDLYNRKFRGFRSKTFSDAPLDIPGLNPALDVNAYHFSGLRWALETGKGIVADDVGLGKTGRALMLAKLSKITGQAQKPAIVVPKSVLANWVAEADFWFPGSKVLVIGETYTRDKDGKLTGKADTPAERNRKFHEFSQNDYDFVLISQPVWNELDLDPITKGDYVNDDFWVQRGDALGNAGDKRLKKIREAYKQAVAQRDFRKRSDAIYFNDLGIDCVLLDEGHAYKNLFAARARFGDTPKFLGGSGLSNRAHDTNLKTKWIREQNGGKGVFLLTATPTKNSPLEVYSMLSHIAPEAFEAIGIKNSEDFLDRFCEFATDNILTVDGKIEQALVVSGFKNLSELREIMRRYIDRRTAEDVGLPLPKRDERQRMIEMSPQQKAVYDELRELASKDADDADGESHIFSIMDKMGKAAIDLELLDPKKYAGAASPKLEEAAENIAKLAKDGGQVVFADHIALHDKLVDLLAKRGIPRDQIAIVNAQAADTSAKRQNISDAFNTGKLKVVIGNTATMGEGMNLQKKTTDIHHLELPWEPASMQQRNGRGLRQGNKNESVRIHSYLSKGSFDGYRYQTLMAKKDWQDLLWHGGDRVENLAREGKFSRDEMLIMLAANPDEARKQYESNKAAALERAAAAGRQEAAEQFVRFQEMKRSHGSLKNQTGPAAQRLRSKIESYRNQLQANKYFHAKDALDMEVPVLIQHDTGTAWHAGKAFEMDPGKDSPIHWSEDAKSKWVVTGVGESDGKPALTVRPYGNTESRSYTVELSKMKHTVRPIEYSEEQERREIAASKAEAATRTVVERALGKTADATQATAAMKHALEQAVEEGRRAHMWHAKTSTRAAMEIGIRNALWAHAPEEIGTPEKLDDLTQNIYRSVLFADAGIPELKNPADLRAVPEDLVTQFQRDLQTHLKAKTRDYQDQWNDPYGLLDKDGKPVAKRSFEARPFLDTHEMMLPMAEHKAKAIDAWIGMEQAKQVKTRYVEGRRSRGSSYGRLKEAGKEEAYPGFEYGSETGNPWDKIGRKLFGDDFVQQAQAEFMRRWKQQPAANLEEATAQLQPISRLKPYGSSDRQWPKEAITALVARATRSGWLNPETSTRLARMAKDAGMMDLAAATVVAGHKDTDPRATLAALAKLKETTGYGAGHISPGASHAANKPVWEAMRRVVDESGLEEKTVKEVAGDNRELASLLTGSYYPSQNQLNATLNEVVGRTA